MRALASCHNRVLRRRPDCRARLLQAGQELAPLREQPTGPLRAQRPHHATALAHPPINEEFAQRPELGSALLGECRAEVLELEHVDVEVAARARDTLEPAELRAEVLKRLGRERGPQLPQQRARPPHGHPEFVQELTVDVSDRPRQVRLDHLEQRLQDPCRLHDPTVRRVRGAREA